MTIINYNPHNAHYMLVHPFHPSTLLQHTPNPIQPKRVLNTNTMRSPTRNLSSSNTRQSITNLTPLAARRSFHSFLAAWPPREITTYALAFARANVVEARNIQLRILSAHEDAVARLTWEHQVEEKALWDNFDTEVETCEDRKEAEGLRRRLLSDLEELDEAFGAELKALMEGLEVRMGSARREREMARESLRGVLGVVI